MGPKQSWRADILLRVVSRSLQLNGYGDAHYAESFVCNFGSLFIGVFAPRTNQVFVSYGFRSFLSPVIA